LVSLGYDVLEAKSGEDALRLMTEHKSISLLLTDVVMPGMIGRKLAEEARQRRPDLKVLYMTGYSRNAIVHQGRLDPGVDLIQKPLSTEQLSAMVRKFSTKFKHSAPHDSTRTDSTRKRAETIPGQCFVPSSHAIKLRCVHFVT
jgi:CheY-like chemotaxis protein